MCARVSIIHLSVMHVCVTRVSSVSPPSIISVSRRRCSQEQRWFPSLPPSLPASSLSKSNPGLCAPHKHLCPTQPLPRPGAGAPQGSLGFTLQPCPWEMCTLGAAEWSLGDSGTLPVWRGRRPGPWGPSRPAWAVRGGAGGRAQAPCLSAWSSGTSARFGEVRPEGSLNRTQQERRARSTPVLTPLPRAASLSLLLALPSEGRLPSGGKFLKPSS